MLFRAVIKPTDNTSDIRDVEQLLKQAMPEGLALEGVEYYNPDNDILPGWCPEDAQSVVKQRTKGMTISYEDAVEVLERASSRFDANIGVDWDVLWIHAQDLLRRGDITLIPMEESDAVLD